MSSAPGELRPELPSRIPPAAMLFTSLLIVALIGILSYQTGQEAAETQRELNISRNLRNSTVELFSALKDAETGQRGFLLTSRPEYLEPYHAAMAALPGIIKDLWSETAGRADQVRRLRELEPVVDNKIAEMRESVELAQEERIREALALVDTGEGKALMDQIRRRSREMTTAAAYREERFRSQAEASSRRLRIISTLGSAVLFGFIALSARTVFRGMSRREQLFEEAHANRELLSITLASIGDAVIATDNLLRITFINRVAQSLTGWREQEAIGTSLSKVFRIVNENTRETTESPVARALAEGKVVGLANHTILIAKGGVETFIDDSAAPIRNRDGRLVGAVLVFRDITDRRVAERALAESEEFARRVVESSPDCVTVLDLEGRLVSMNANGCRQMEIDDFSIREKFIWSDFWPAEEQAKAVGALQTASGGTTARFQGLCPTAKGTQRWWEVIIAPILDSNGTPMRLLCVSRDITERTLSEQLLRIVHRQLEDRAAELRRSNEDLTQFAYSASHDLRSPLNSVQAFAELVAERFSAQLGDDGQELMGYITGGVERMQRLITGLLAFATAGASPSAADVHADAGTVLRTVLEDLRVEIETEKAEVAADSLPEVGVQDIHLQQLLQNLIGNALKYRGAADPRVHISASQDGEMWLFRAADNGAGIDAEHLDMIFQPFKRLHGSDISGSGIGLATCRRIVVGYGGRIWAESTPGAGSTFYFTLPKASLGQPAHV